MNQQPSPPKKRLPVRWLTLGEVIALAALIIAGLGYWDTHRERAEQDRARAAAEQEQRAQAREGALKQSFLLTGSVDGSGDLVRLSPVHPDQVIQTQSLVFPKAVRADPVQTTGNARIERGWIAGGLARAERKAGGDVHGRLPVGIVTTFVDGGETKTDRAIYLLGFSLQHHWLRGDKIELEGLSLSRRVPSGDLQAAVDAAWARQAGAR